MRHMPNKEKIYNISLKFIFTGAAVFFLWACTYHNEEELYGSQAGTCDTTTVSYTADILPLLQSSCYACHSQAASLGGVNIEGHSRVKLYADNGRLLGAASHAPGFSPMPKNGSKLPACEINKIRRWINLGAPNN
jgi:hypothetical protein